MVSRLAETVEVTKNFIMDLYKMELLNNARKAMSWLEISAEEYSKLYAKDVDNLSVYSSATCIGPGYIGQRYFSEDYILTEWVLGDQTFPCLKVLKSHGEWKHWKWEGPAPTENE